MTNIDELCEDGKARYYAAILFDNAAMTLLTDSKLTKITGEFVVYNLCKEDEYDNMKKDPHISHEVKGQILISAFNRQLEGWHVIRTEKPLEETQLEQASDAIQEKLNDAFYSKSRMQLGTIRDSLVMQELYVE